MKRMIAASLKSIVIWICIYFMIANCIVVWKWLTPPTSTTNDTTTTTTSMSSSSTTTIESLQQQQQQEQEIQKLNDMINKFDKALNHSEQRLRSMEQQFLNYQQYIISTTTLSYNNNNIKLHDDNDNNDGIFVNVSDYIHTQKLFATNNITTTIVTNEIVAIVIDELQQLIDNQQWDILHNIIINNKNNNNNNQEEDDDDDKTPQCNNEHNNQYVSKEQLQSRIEYILDTILLSQQQESILPLSFDTSINTIQQYLHSILSNEISLLRKNDYSKTLEQVNEEESNDIQVVDRDMNCLTESIITEAINIWMNIGLETIYQQYCNTIPENKNNNHNIYYTIRQELLQSIQQYCHDMNIDCNHIRFDIPETTITSNSNEQQQNHPIVQRLHNKKYLRQLIDLPSIYYLSIYIDIVLERMTGMNDKLDDIIDQYIYNPILASNIQHDESTKSIMNYVQHHHHHHHNGNTNTVLIGPIIVSYILNQLGNIPLPTNKIYQNE